MSCNNIYIGQYRKFVDLPKNNHCFQVVDICRGLLVGAYRCSNTTVEKFSPTSVEWIVNNSIVTDQQVCNCDE